MNNTNVVTISTNNAVFFKDAMNELELVIMEMND